jgi:hypothetical protein
MYSLGERVSDKIHRARSLMEAMLGLGLWEHSCLVSARKVR